MEKSVKVVIINGTGGSGKDTFVDLCGSYIHRFTKDLVFNVSSVELVKEAAKLLGWGGGKTEKDRKFLADMKFLVTEYNDGCFNFLLDKYLETQRIFNSVNAARHAILFMHVREPEEIEKLKSRLSATTLLITNNRVQNIESNEADRRVYEYTYDVTISNNGTIEDLRVEAEKFVKKLFGE